MNYYHGTHNITIGNDCFIIVDGIKTTTSTIPSISVSKEGYWIVNEKYTNFEANNRNRFTVGADEDGHLTINGTVTSFDVKVDIKQGGYVDHLPLSSMLLMILMCAISLPMMRILKQIIPWLKRQVKNITILLSKF